MTNGFHVLVIPVSWLTKELDCEKMIDSVAEQWCDYHDLEYLGVVDPTLPESQKIYEDAFVEVVQNPAVSKAEIVDNVAWQIELPKGIKWLRVVKCG